MVEWAIGQADLESKRKRIALGIPRTAFCVQINDDDNERLSSHVPPNIRLFKIALASSRCPLLQVLTVV